MLDKQLITDIVGRFIENSDKYIVDVKLAAGNIIEVIIDSDSTICIDDCAAVSRFVESSLNRDEEDFELNVYSAGLSETFKLLRQYKKHIGREVEILLKSGNKIKGILCAVDDNVAEIKSKVEKKSENKKRKEIVEEITTYNFDDIKSTKLVIKVQ